MLKKFLQMSSHEESCIEGAQGMDVKNSQIGTSLQLEEEEDYFVQTYHCPSCDFKTKDKQDYKEHLSGHADNSVILSKETNKSEYLKCSTCSFTTIYKHSLKRHMLTHDESEEHTDQTLLSTTSNKIRKDVFGNLMVLVCEECNYKTKKRLLMEKHLQRHKRGKQIKSYDCQLCDYASKYKQHFERHMLKHLSDKNLYKCIQCDYSTVYIDNFKRHKMKHSSVKAFSCPQCSYATAYQDNYKRHMVKHSSLKNLSCPHCSYTSAYPEHYERHLLKHSKPMTYKCPNCDYTSAYFDNYKRHLLKHTGEKNFKCEYCEYSTVYVDNFRRHVTVHTGEGSKACPHCNYSTTIKYKFKQHMATHTGEGLFKCKYCPYTTPRNYQIKRHMSIHTKEDRYVCRFCGHHTAYKGAHKKHMLKHGESADKNPILPSNICKKDELMLEEDPLDIEPNQKDATSIVYDQSSITSSATEDNKKHLSEQIEKHIFESNDCDSTAIETYNEISNKDTIENTSKTDEYASEYTVLDVNLDVKSAVERLSNGSGINTRIDDHGNLIVCVANMPNFNDDSSPECSNIEEAVTVNVSENSPNNCTSSNPRMAIVHPFVRSNHNTPTSIPQQVKQFIHIPQTQQINDIINQSSMDVDQLAHEKSSSPQIISDQNQVGLKNCVNEVKPLVEDRSILVNTPIDGYQNLSNFSIREQNVGQYILVPVPNQNNRVQLVQELTQLESVVRNGVIFSLPEVRNTPNMVIINENGVPMMQSAPPNLVQPSSVPKIGIIDSNGANQIAVQPHNLKNNYAIDPQTGSLVALDGGVSQIFANGQSFIIGPSVSGQSLLQQSHLPVHPIVSNLSLQSPAVSLQPSNLSIPLSSVPVQPSVTIQPSNMYVHPNMSVQSNDISIEPARFSVQSSESLSNESSIDGLNDITCNQYLSNTVENEELFNTNSNQLSNNTLLQLVTLDYGSVVVSQAPN